MISTPEKGKNMSKQPGINLYKKHIKNLAVGLTAAGALVACGGEPETEYSTVQGRLESQESAEAEGGESSSEETTASNVIAYRVTASGELEQVASADVNAQGAYQIDIPTEELEQERQDLVIRAYNSSEAEIGSVALSRKFEANTVYTASPMSQETSVEVTVYVEAKSSGTWCETCTLPELRAMIDQELAARVDASSRSDRHAKVAAAISGSIQAQSNLFAELEGEFEDAQARQKSADAVASSQLTLDAKLHAASSASAKEGAREASERAYVDAYATAGFGNDTLVRAFEARAKATSSLSTGLEADARASMISDAEVHHAVFADTALQGSLTGEASTEYKQAHAALLSELEASAEAGADIEGEVEASWATWKGMARDELNAQFELVTQTALDGMATSFDAATQAYLGALGTLDSSASIAAETIIAAQSTLYTTFTADANVTVLTATGVEEDRARAYLEARAHIAAAGQVMQ
jgi:hypothetical protein